MNNRPSFWQFIKGWRLIALIVIWASVFILGGFAIHSYFEKPFITDAHISYPQPVVTLGLNNNQAA